MSIFDLVAMDMRASFIGRIRAVLRFEFVEPWVQASVTPGSRRRVP